ncbi:MAG: organic hydroperoxide resistance protein [Clostridiaceae bacterium]|jgi:osmotically inducible protein OsmC|nr:organic hydroperoxide resistance protein [Clostridiaceae bacterium]
MEIMYKTTAVSTRGRSGKVEVKNSSLEFEMAAPVEMGGAQDAQNSKVNPEQLFAAGYAACFGSALQHVIREKKLPIPTPSVEATVGIGKNEAGGFQLEVEIVALITGLDQAAADAVINEAHYVCPYSNATRGNIDVSVTAKII